MPLSEFNNTTARPFLKDKEAGSPDIQDVITYLRNDASNQQFGMGFVNSDIEVTYTNDKWQEQWPNSSALSTQEIYIDNWRIVPLQVRQHIRLS